MVEDELRFQLIYEIHQVITEDNPHWILTINGGLSLLKFDVGSHKIKIVGWHREAQPRVSRSMDQNMKFVEWKERLGVIFCASIVFS